jgi:hypothetical protein
MRYPVQPYYFPPVPPTRGDDGFAKGFVASACLSAFQGVADPVSPGQIKRVLRHGLQGGAALAAGSRAALALRYHDYTGAVLATAAGAAGVLLIEKLLSDSAESTDEEDVHG